MSLNHKEKRVVQRETDSNDDQKHGIRLTQNRSICQMTVVYSLYALTILFSGMIISLFCSTSTFIFALIISWSVCFFAGMIAIFSRFFLRRKNISEYVFFLLGSFCRSGIPLTVALVLIFVFDKIILIHIFIGMVAIYCLMLPCEIWISLPVKNKDQ
ncbi:MAG: hypothetical protein Q4C95_07955 [Planctomycetia bacterium]|nr:hypothetical protein [Planctomycetia bacterium]